MQEKDFLDQAEAMLARLEQAIEQAAEAAGVDIDIEPQPGGILRLTFDNDSVIIINRHLAAREIWVAAKAGGFHYRHENGRWVGTRDGEDLVAVLSRLISQQAQTPLVLSL